MTTEHELESLEVRLFLEAIHARYGYDLRDYTEGAVQRRVQAVLARSGLPHLGELQHRVLHEPEYFASLVDQLTVQVSDVFRDPSFYLAFRAHVVPVLRTYPLLKVWHAGCATGEEAYTSAILLSEEGLYDRSQLYATDFSGGALAQAKEGVYPAEKLETFSENYRAAGGRGLFSDHCHTAYGRIGMNPSLRRNIVFFQHNLVSDYAFGEMHVVFCRNVLMYFGEELRARVVAKFMASLCNGGFLCLGQNETLTESDGAAHFEEIVPGERIYRYDAW